MQIVEILDEDPAATGARPAPRSSAGHGPDDDPPPRDWGALAGRWWPVAAALAVVLVVVALAGARRDRDWADRIAETPGMVRPIGSPPAVLWQVPVAATADVLAAAGAVVVVSADDDAWRVTSRDARTGTEGWSTTLAATDRSGMQGGLVACPHAGADVGDVLVCLVMAPTAVVDTTVDGLDGASSGARVVALASDDGHVLGGWRVAGEVLASARADGDVVVASVGGDGHVEVSRHDAVTGDVSWTYRSRDPLDAPSALAVPVVDLTADLAILGQMSTTVVDLTDGRELFYAPFLSFVLAGPATTGFGTWSVASDGALYDASGERLFALPGLPARTRVSDRSTDDPIVLDLGRQVSGRDPGTGAQVWSATTDLDPEIQVDHRMVLAHDDRFGVLDLRTGAMSWTRDTDTPLPWSPLSDGALVLAPATARDGSPELAGYGLDDGVRAWSVGLPDDVRSVEAQGGHLLVRTDRDVVALG